LFFAKHRAIYAPEAYREAILEIQRCSIVPGRSFFHAYPLSVDEGAVLAAQVAEQKSPVIVKEKT
jgi:hypothetical protein